MSLNIGKFLGLILDTPSNRHFHFICDTKSQVKHDVPVGVKTPEGEVVVGVVDEIKSAYYLDDPDNFFIAKAVKSELQDLNSSSRIQVALKVRAKIIGYFKPASDSTFAPIEDSIPRYTSQPLQKVYYLDSTRFLSLYGLSENGICVGHSRYPIDVSVALPTYVFKRHTLVSGVTGSGKSRLVALIGRRLAMAGAHITIVDPHDEYTDLLSAGSEDLTIKRINISPSLSVPRTLGSESIVNEDLFFSSTLITAPTLCRLMRNLSSQQEEFLTMIFNRVYSDPNRRDISFVTSEIQNIADDIRNSKEKDSPLHKMYIGLLSRLNDIVKNKLVQKNLPSWLVKQPFTTEIFIGDYNKEGYGKRIVTAILEQFLRYKSTESLRVVIIEEAHQLLNLGSNETQNVISQLLREARKFNTSILLVTQNSDDVPVDIRNQIQNHFQFREEGKPELEDLPNRVCKSVINTGLTPFHLHVGLVESKRESDKPRRRTQ